MSATWGNKPCNTSELYQIVAIGSSQRALRRVVLPQLFNFHLFVQDCPGYSTNTLPSPKRERVS
ncbi:hypothetical protein [Nostoc sp.]|uniref:hypothetical protein n=1 Tax=Nostoc sp. TaxID=1180 RepID=UPI002FFB3812